MVDIYLYRASGPIKVSVILAPSSGALVCVPNLHADTLPIWSKDSSFLIADPAFLLRKALSLNHASKLSGVIAKANSEHVSILSLYRYQLLVVSSPFFHAV